MKKRNKVRKRIIICLSVCFLLLSFLGNAYAVSSKSEETITPSQIKEWDDGANVTSESSGTGENFRVSVFADTNGLKEGYYSIYLFDNKVRSVRSYDGVRFNIKNDNNTELKINLTFTVNSKVSISLTDSSFAILESDNQNINETVAPAYGTISIPAKFDGTVYVPLSQLYTSDGERVTLTKIQSWGITTVMSQDQKIHYQIGNIAFLRESVASMKDSYYFITVSGNSTISIPHTGSVIENYNAQVKDFDNNSVDQNVTFSLAESIAGVSVSKNGKLEVGSDCVASEIKVCAKSENSINSGVFMITLQHNDTAAGSDEIPRASEVLNIMSPVYTQLSKSVTLIKFLSIAIALIIGAIFLNWFKDSNNNYNAIKRKLYKTNDNEEEDEH